MKKNKFKITLIVTLIASYYLLITTVSAQTSPEFIISWKALNYTPADYQGKSFPIQSTPVEAGFDLLAKNKIIDLSKNKIWWELNGTNIKSGIGEKTARFTSNGGDQTMRISVEYNGSTLYETFTVASAKPQVVIDTKNQTKNLSLGKYTFTALPYFFNILNLNELSFDWMNNGQKITGQTDSPERLDLNFESEGSPKKTDLNLSVSAINLYNQLEIARGLLNLIVK